MTAPELRHHTALSIRLATLVSQLTETETRIDLHDNIHPGVIRDDALAAIRQATDAAGSFSSLISRSINSSTIDTT